MLSLVDSSDLLIFYVCIFVKVSFGGSHAACKGPMRGEIWVVSEAPGQGTDYTQHGGEPWH